MTGDQTGRVTASVKRIAALLLLVLLLGACSTGPSEAELDHWRREVQHWSFMEQQAAVLEDIACATLFFTYWGTDPLNNLLGDNDHAYNVLNWCNSGGTNG